MGERATLTAARGRRCPMNTPITSLGEPKIDKWRETRIDYTESIGDAYKSLSIETYLTHDELVALVRELRGDAE
jgi:hypothetical protein